jgi:hypothetical protein
VWVHEESSVGAWRVWCGCMKSLVWVHGESSVGAWRVNGKTLCLEHYNDLVVEGVQCRFPCVGKYNSTAVSRKNCNTLYYI